MSYPEYNIGEKKERKNPAKASTFAGFIFF
jgi:hypothetical protein